MSTPQDVVRSTCWACPAPAAVRYIAEDEPDYPQPHYCATHADTWPPPVGVFAQVVVR